MSLSYGWGVWTRSKLCNYICHCDGSASCCPGRSFHTAWCVLCMSHLHCLTFDVCEYLRKGRYCYKWFPLRYLRWVFTAVLFSGWVSPTSMEMRIGCGYVPKIAARTKEKRNRSVPNLVFPWSSFARTENRVFGHVSHGPKGFRFLRHDSNSCRPGGLRIPPLQRVIDQERRVFTTDESDL